MGEQTTLHIKVDKKAIDKFKATAEKYERKYTDVLKEMISAYADRRITITPSTSQIKQQKEIYDDNGK